MKLVGKIKKKIKKKFERQIPVYVPTLYGTMLRGKGVLITGGTSGIGYTIAKTILNCGGEVIITSRQEEHLLKSKHQLVNETKCSEKRIRTAILDLENGNLIEDQIKKIIKDNVDFQIDILVNNAGAINASNFGNSSLNDYNQILDINLRGTYFVSQIIANYMIENKIRGNICNIASSSSLRPAASPYTIAKWGERGLTLGMAKKLLKYGIVVNGVAPGQTATPMMIKTSESNLKNMSSPIGRYITPEEIANGVIFLISDMGRNVIGDILYMTGGAGVITFDDIEY